MPPPLPAVLLGLVVVALLAGLLARSGPGEGAGLGAWGGPTELVVG